MPQTAKSKMDTAITVAVIGLVGTVIVGILNSPLLMKIIERTPTPVPSTPVPGATVPAATGQLEQVFSADFENGTTSGFGFETGDWTIEKVKNNRVLQGVATGSFSPAAKAYFGPSDFSNGVVEFRFLLKNLAGGPYFDFRLDTDIGGYVLYFDPHDQTLALATNMLINGEWDFAQVAPGTWRDFSLQQETWYAVRVEAEGEQITASVDGNQIYSALDSRLQQGQLRFALEPNATVLFDDVKVWVYR